MKTKIIELIDKFKRNLLWGQFPNCVENFLEKHHYYKIEDLRIGGHCGLCGAWIYNVPEHIYNLAY